MAATRDRVVTDVDERRAAILECIRGARRELVLSLFRCKDNEIFAELARASARGVEVKALVTSRAKGGPEKLHKLCRKLAATGAAVSQYTDAVVKYHAKYLVADDGPAMVASLNFTKKCFTSTLDALVITHDRDVVSGLRRLMAADQGGLPLPDLLCRRLIVGPERARRQFTALIDSATDRIRILDAKLSDPEVVALLSAKRAAGVKVEIFGCKRIGELRSHGKVMLIDDRVAVVGGMALAALSLDFRREVAILVDDPAAVADVRTFFDAIVAAAPLVAAAAIDTTGEVLC